MNDKSSNTPSISLHLTHPMLFFISIASEVRLVYDIYLYFESGIISEPHYSIRCAAAPARCTLINLFSFTPIFIVGFVLTRHITVGSLKHRRCGYVQQSPQ
jgi:hypothetical protein